MTGNGHSASFIYDGFGRCVRRTIDNETRLFAYDGWNPICEWDQDGNWTAVNIYGPGSGEILGRYDATHGALIYKQDDHGNVMFLLDDSSQIVEKYTYDAYGRPTILSPTNTQLSTSAVGNRFMFQGREYLSELGISDFRNRMYYPDLGRFLQSDPLGFGGGDANLYRYCGDDPVNYIDPTGEVQITIFGGARYGGRVTVGYNAGQFNFGGYVGLANGLVVSIDPLGPSSHAPGTDFGLIGTAGYGQAYASVSTTSYVGTDTSYVSASGRIYMVSGGRKYTPGTGWSSTGPSLTFGRGAFAGIGASYYSAGPSIEPPNINWAGPKWAPQWISTGAPLDATSFGTQSPDGSRNTIAPTYWGPGRDAASSDGDIPTAPPAGGGGDAGSSGDWSTIAGFGGGGDYSFAPGGGGWITQMIEQKLIKH